MSFYTRTVGCFWTPGSDSAQTIQPFRAIMSNRPLMIIQIRLIVRTWWMLSILHLVISDMLNLVESLSLTMETMNIAALSQGLRFLAMGIALLLNYHSWQTFSSVPDLEILLEVNLNFQVRLTIILACGIFSWANGSGSSMLKYIGSNPSLLKISVELDQQISLKQFCVIFAFLQTFFCVFWSWVWQQLSHTQ